MKNHLKTRRILIENTKQFFQQRCWKCLMHLYNYNKEFEMFTKMIKENKIKYATGVLGVLSPPCYICAECITGNILWFWSTKKGIIR